MNDKTLLALALAKTLYSEKHNYLDTFAPFLLRGVDTREYKNINEIENFLEARYSLDIPLNTIQSILKNLERQGFVTLKGKRANNLAAISNDKATDYVDNANIESEKIQRKQNKLIQKLKDYLKENLGISFSETEINDKLKRYVLKNVADLALGNWKVDFNYDSQSPVNKAITRFLIKIDNKEQELYESFNDLLKGAVLWQTIAHKNNTDNESGIGQIEVFLDTNIILSLLGLHHESINRAADQLNKFLQNDKNIYVRVFDKTIEEVIDLLAAYKYNKDNYGSQRVNHVYFFLKMKGYDGSDIDLLISKLEEKLEELEVHTQKLGFERPEDLPGREEELYNSLYTQNREYETGKEDDYQKTEKAIHKSSFHDVAIISKIRQIRNGWQTSFESCKAIFVTNSYRLYSFSSNNKLYKEAVPEVITDVALTNILWLKNPDKDFGVTIEHLLHVHASEFLINNQIWRKFLNTLQRMHGEGEIDERDFARLTSKNQLTDKYLLEKDPSDDITPNSVKELNNELKEEERQKENKIERLEIKDEVKERLVGIMKSENQDLETENKSLKKVNKDLREEISDLDRDQKDLKGQFRKFQIETFFGQLFNEKVKHLRKKTWKGFGLALGVIGLFYLLVSVLKLIPYFYPEGILGFDVSKPSFENAFTLVVGLLFMIGQAGVKSYRDSSWSIGDAYLALFNQERLKEKYSDQLRRAAEEKFEGRSNEK